MQDHLKAGFVKLVVTEKGADVIAGCESWNRYVKASQIFALKDNPSTGGAIVGVEGKHGDEGVRTVNSAADILSQIAAIKTGVVREVEVTPPPDPNVYVIAGTGYYPQRGMVKIYFREGADVVEKWNMADIYQTYEEAARVFNSRQFHGQPQRWNIVKASDCPNV